MISVLRNLFDDAVADVGSAGLINAIIAVVQTVERNLLADGVTPQTVIDTVIELLQDEMKSVSPSVPTKPAS